MSGQRSLSNLSNFRQCLENAGKLDHPLAARVVREMVKDVANDPDTSLELTVAMGRVIAEARQAELDKEATGN